MPRDWSLIIPATNRGRGIKLWPLWQTPFNNAGTLLADPGDHAGRGGFCFADRLRECRESASGTGLHTAARNDGAGGGRGEPWPVAAAASYRGTDSVGGGGDGWAAVCALVPACAGSAVSGARGRGHDAARRDRLASARAQRRRLPRSPLYCWGWFRRCRLERSILRGR